MTFFEKNLIEQLTSYVKAHDLSITKINVNISENNCSHNHACKLGTKRGVPVLFNWLSGA